MREGGDAEGGGRTRKGLLPGDFECSPGSPSPRHYRYKDHTGRGFRRSPGAPLSVPVPGILARTGTKATHPSRSF